jgi:hypothetical protein
MKQLFEKIAKFISENAKYIIYFIQKLFEMKKDLSQIKNAEGVLLEDAMKAYFAEINADIVSLAEEGGLRRRSGKIKKRKLVKLATTEEIVDTAGDSYQVIYVVVRSLGDGFDLEDVIAWIGQQGAISEIINDFPIFVEAIGQHKIENSTELMIDIRENIESRMIKIEGLGITILNGLWYAATSAEFVQTVLSSAKAQIDGAKGITGGTLLIPVKE